jgi:glucose-6-phosphate 1-dehydrogenase
MDSSSVLSGGQQRIPDPFTLVIFGASGDLTKRKLIPAVYSLFREGFLPEKFNIVGYARRDKSNDAWRKELRESVEKYSRIQPVNDATWDAFAARISYHRADLDDVEGYRSLKGHLCGDDEVCALPGNCLFYAATHPSFFPIIASNLKEVGLNAAGKGAGRWARIIIEKPFGHDLASARELNDLLTESFEERQIFRIDHYLGKETVQNLLVFRFANAIFEPIWNNKHVDHVQIAVAEAIGVEGRGGYFDQSGSLRDMVQNHMMHLLCLVAMESPIRLDAESVRDEKVKLLKALRPIPNECALNGVVRAQYTRGITDGREIPGYLEEDGVASDSKTETFVAFKAHIDNWRWAGVPFYMRTGKALPCRMTEISIHFKNVPRVLFNADSDHPLARNVLTLRIQPREGISIRFQVKVPGVSMEIKPHELDFGYAKSFGKEPPEAYERLLLEAALGDATLFTRSDEIEVAWQHVSPILEGCAQCPKPLPTYEAGTWGPVEAEELIQADGREWQLCRRRE